MYAYASSNVGATEVGIFQMMRAWDEMQATWMQAGVALPTKLSADTGMLWQVPGANGAADRSLTPATTQWLKPSMMFAAPSLEKAVAPGQWYTFTIPSIVQNWVKRDANAGVAMKYVDGDVMVAYTFASSSYQYTPQRPSLTIQYVNP